MNDPDPQLLLRGDVPAPLVAAALAAARELPTDHIRRLATGLATAGTPDNAGDLLTRPPTHTYRMRAAAVLDAWRAAPDLPGAEVAALVTGAHAGWVASAADERVDVVWSGPTTGRVHVRLASQVILDLARTAEHDLLLVSFAAYRVPYLHDQLRRTAIGGVRLTLVLESEEQSGGRLTHDAARAFRGVPNVTVLEWPHDKRPSVGSGVALMHAKVAVADGKAALVSSTNLTDAGLDKNMECGLLVRGGPIPAALRDHFRQLQYCGELQAVRPPAS